MRISGGTVDVGGGILVSGEADENFNDVIEVGGGVRLNGEADENFNDIIEVGGGTLIGGIADETMVFNPLSVGGVLSGGEADENFNDVIEVGGGVLASGEANEDFNDVVEVGGGVLAGGEADEAIEFNPLSVGGTLVGGKALESKDQTVQVSGGAIVGGIANVTSTETFIPIGGILVSGSVKSEFFLEGIGGVTVGSVTVEPSENVSGGTITSGKALILVINSKNRRFCFEFDINDKILLTGGSIIIASRRRNCKGQNIYTSTSGQKFEESFLQQPVNRTDVGKLITDLNNEEIVPLPKGYKFIVKQ